MAESLSVEVDDKAFLAAMKGLESEIPRAMAGAINSALFAARKEVDYQWPQYFATRTPWAKKGLHVNMATRSTLAGDVGFLESRWFMASQVEGDPARKKPGNKPIWQPVMGGPRSPRPDPAKRIIPARRPNVAKDPVRLKTPTKSGNKRRYRGKSPYLYMDKANFPKLKVSGIYYRTRVGDKTQRRRLYAAYWKQDSMSVKPRLPLKKIVGDIVSRDWPVFVSHSIKHAIAKAASKK